MLGTALAASGLVGDRAGVAVALVRRELVVGVIYLDRSGAALAASGLVGDRAGVAVAVVLRELVVGVIYLDRSGAAGRKARS